MFSPVIRFKSRHHYATAPQQKLRRSIGQNKFYNGVDKALLALTSLTPIQRFDKGKIFTEIFSE